MRHAGPQAPRSRSAALDRAPRARCWWRREATRRASSRSGATTGREAHPVVRTGLCQAACPAAAQRRGAQRSRPPSGQPDRAQAPTAGAGEAPAAGPQLDRAQGRAAGRDRHLEAAAAQVGPLGQGGELAVGRRDSAARPRRRAAADRLDAHADHVPARRVHRRRCQELVAPALVAARSGAVERPRHRRDAARGRPRCGSGPRRRRTAGCARSTRL